MIEEARVDPCSEVDRARGSTIAVFVVALFLALGSALEAAGQAATTCMGREPTLVGTPRGENLTGTSGVDVIVGLGGQDIINGLEGDDVICGGEGDDVVLGGAGADTLAEESTTLDSDTLIGGSGDDRLFGELGDDVLLGGDGNDELNGGDGDDEDIQPGKDTLDGGPDADSLAGGPGPDLLRGGPGEDSLAGGGEDDHLVGGPGADSLSGETGDDELVGGPGADTLAGADGEDDLLGGVGADELSGDSENDHLSGGPGPDGLAGDAGDDLLFGNVGDDGLHGGPGDDFLSGGPGDDLLDGGPGADTLKGGPGHDELIEEPTLAFLVDAGSREAIATWAADLSIAEINAAVTALDQARRERLAEIVLETNATGDDRERLLRTVRTILADSDFGFYAEILSYTFVELTPGGFFGTCNRVFLDPSTFAELADRDARNVLTHELLHSFNCVNGGPVGSLDEGSAIWIIPVGFGEPLLPGQSWAEATYGSKLFHKVFFGNPNLPLVAPLNPTPKLLELYGWLSANDPSKLPWNSTERLVTCFDRYFADLNRDVDFVSVWLPMVDAATQEMLADPECRPL
jgi:Ca2+-binding RTX toxin-like protein